MNKNQKALRAVADELDAIETRSAEIIAAGEINDETDKELRELAGKKKTLLERRASLNVLLEADDTATRRSTDDGDPEKRERIAWRGKASLGRILSAGIQGQRLEGADEEYRQAVGTAERSIPLDIFEREIEVREDAATGAPSVIGVNMQNVVPAIFSKSVAGRVGITMPRAPSGQYSVPRLTTSLSGTAKDKGADQESTAAAFTIDSAKPRRISARLSLRAEDLAEVGIPGFEASLRQNLMLVMGDVLDTQIVAGDGTAPNVKGLFARFAADDLNKLDADPTDVVTFPSFVADMAGLLDGKWATTLAELRMVTNAAVMAKLASTFQEPRFVDKGTGGTANASGVGTQSIETAADWGLDKLSALWCNSRMPASASNIGKCIAVRAGMMTEPTGGGAMPAVLPTWGDLSIVDPYSDSASATEHVTLHMLVGDQVIVRHPDAFAEVRVRTA